MIYLTFNLVWDEIIFHFVFTFGGTNHQWDVNTECKARLDLISLFKLKMISYVIFWRWLSLMNSMLREAKWVSDKSVPTRDAYMTNGFVSFALGPIVLPALYLVGPVLSEEVVCSSEYQNLYKVMSTFGRLLNDIHSFERESKEGKLNVVSLYMVDGSGETVTAEESIKEIKSIIKTQAGRITLATKRTPILSLGAWVAQPGA
ncbi:hypothetical protein TEA_007778 [Camellia sinensis var. sinensis]|uniref:Terpene synthase metal-binding domain-containing protein n=1 Tax=Camellia sinensis var. sinensis TaxID=542762 RepID=A0A4S4EEH8_CAMSN|nr:hypothetical protein TEA_007778 [Camellia sinensis var. sinensis]